jgi:hypothetical protein
MKEIQTHNQDLLALEQRLRSKLHPIKPDQKFVGDLRLRLEDTPFYQRQKNSAYTILSVVGGLLVGLIIFLIGRGLLQET